MTKRGDDRRPPGAAAREEASAARERAVAGRETAASARERTVDSGEATVGEREDAALVREQGVAVRERSAALREEAVASKSERQLLLRQMKEANEKLTLASIRAEELAEEREEARHLLEVSESELRREAEFREQLIATVSHDLRNPLGTISMAVDLLLRDDAHLEAGDRALVTGIRRGVDRMTRMIVQLLDFTRAHIGRGLPADRRPMDMHKLCHEVLVDLETQHSMAGRFRCDFAGEAEGVWDPDLLAQLVSNLGGNAIEHGAQGTPIDVRLRDERDGVALEVRNQGEPIPSELLTAIFAPFRQGGPHRGSRGGGLGLGLYISSEVARAHGGSIAVRSTAAEGTTFSVWLPRRPPQAARENTAPGPDAGRPVLLVDDDREWTDLLGMFLRTQGLRVWTAADGGEALAIMAGARPAVVLLDMAMPVMNGRELLGRMAADPALAGVPVALVTSDAAPPPGHAVFRKPVTNLDALLAFVRAAVAEPAE